MFAQGYRETYRCDQHRPVKRQDQMRSPCSGSDFAPPPVSAASQRAGPRRRTLWLGELRAEVWLSAQSAFDVSQGVATIQTQDTGSVQVQVD